MESVWKKSERPESQALTCNIVRDIVVVGGGIAGYLTAYRLAEYGHNVTLVEARRLFSGVTGKTTAHMDAMQGVLYSSLIKEGAGKAQLYFESQLEAINEYEKLVQKYSIDCCFKRRDSYMFTARKKDKLLKEFEALKEIGAVADFLDGPEILGFKMQGAIKLYNQAQFNPIKFLEGLPVKFEIIENTRITDVDFDNKILYAENGRIDAKKIVIATNFPIINFPGWYFLKMYKSSSYTIALDKAPDIGGLYQSDEENGLTFRNYEDKIIIGGLDHRTGRTDKEDKYKRLYERTRHLSDNGDITHHWSANDCVTSDSIPYAGYFSRKSKDVYVITGFNKWGMTNSMITSKLVADMINGVENKYESLFSPQRKKKGFGFFLVNSLSVVKNLVIRPILPVCKCARFVKKGEGAIAYYRFRKRAVYRDPCGELHVCHALCSHLHCQLKFNPNDETWDCPCHGSRFDVDGNLITPPSVRNLESIK